MPHVPVTPAAAILNLMDGMAYLNSYFSWTWRMPTRYLGATKVVDAATAPSPNTVRVAYGAAPMSPSTYRSKLTVTSDDDAGSPETEMGSVSAAARPPR